LALRRRPLQAAHALAFAFALTTATAAVCIPAGSARGESAPRAADLTALETSIREIETLLLDANFTTAVGVAESTRAWADEIPSSPEVREARSRLQVLLATGWIALGDEEAARDSMRRAVAVWPLLTLHERTTSPRVLAVYRAVRTSRDTRSAP
jgi:hypothetical protein